MKKTLKIFIILSYVSFFGCSEKKSEDSVVILPNRTNSDKTNTPSKDTINKETSLSLDSVFYEKYLSQSAIDIDTIKFSYELQKLIKEKEYLIPRKTMVEDFKINKLKYSVTLSSTNGLYYLNVKKELGEKLKINLDEKNDMIMALVKVGSFERNIIDEVGVEKNKKDKKKLFIVKGELLDFISKGKNSKLPTFKFFR